MRACLLSSTYTFTYLMRKEVSPLNGVRCKHLVPHAEVGCVPGYGLGDVAHRED